MTAPRIAFLGKVLLAGAVLASPFLLTAQGNDPLPGSATTATQPNSWWKSQHHLPTFLVFLHLQQQRSPFRSRISFASSISATSALNLTWHANGGNRTYKGDLPS